MQPHLRQVTQAYLRVRLTLCMTVQRHGLGQEIRKVRQVRIEVHLQIQKHVAHQVVHLAFRAEACLFGLRCQLVDRHVGHLAFVEVEHRVCVQLEVTQRIRQGLVSTLTVFEFDVGSDERHLRVAERTACRSIQRYYTIDIEVFETTREGFRYQRQQRFDLPFAGSEFDVHVDSVAYRHLSFHAHLKIIDCQTGTVEGEMHRLEVHRHRSNKFEM